MIKKAWTTLLVAALLLLATSVFAEEEFDMSKLFSLQTTLENAEPLVDVDTRRIEVPYINKDGEVTSRPVVAYMPTKAKQPMPCVYVPHYAIAEDSAELRAYLAKGWAVISPTDFDVVYNGHLTDDDLVFNNAALYMIRHMPEIDNQRIALIGGSAGGYTTLMLGALQMGNCAAIATAPITNVYFNFYKYFPAAKEVNEAGVLDALSQLAENAGTTDDAQAELSPDALLAFLQFFQDNFPMPFLAMVEDNFIAINDNFPDPDDITRWEALSPVGLADCFSAPLVIVHCTSDLLVPVDQITRAFTYPAEGETMPEGFSTRLDASYPGKLGHSLTEELPAELVHVEWFMSADYVGEMNLPYNPSAMISINIFDDGPTQRYASHSASTGSATIIDTGFVEDMFEKTLAETEQLMPGKLILMLNRYLGKSVQLPAHEGVDDTVYGSLAIYRLEIAEELSQWVKNHSMEELDMLVKDVIADVENEAERDVWADAWRAIQAQLPV